MFLVINIFMMVMRSIKDPGGVSVIMLLFICILTFLVVGIVVALYTSSKVGFYAGFLGALLSLAIFPIGTGFGFFGIKRLLATKSIYLDKSLSFKLLRSAFAPYR